MDRATYAEAELVQNRVSVLLFGGTTAERRAWAEEAAMRLGWSVTVVTTAAALPAALALKQGVVLVEDVLALGEGAQQQLVRCLQTQEERPKLVSVVPSGAAATVASEGLRLDLHYALRLARVDLEEPGLRDILAKRRARRPTLPPASVPTGPRPGARPAPVRRPTPAKKAVKRHKHAPAAAKRSRR